MKAIEFKEQTIIIAEHQEEYESLPAHIEKGVYGTTTFCWELTLKERLKLLFTGKLWHQVLTFNKPLQPQLLQVDKPELTKVESWKKEI